MKKILLIVHQATSDPGLVGQLLQRAGYTLDIRCPNEGAELPPHLDEHLATVVFGGPMSANDDDTLPCIRTELDWIPIALASGKPYLGICLGAQMLSRVLGGTVSPHPQDVMEIGYFPVSVTAEGRSEFEGLQSVYHWHREGFTVPRSAVLLAEGEVFENQAFRYGQTAYGVQFHPEITQPMIDRWTTVAAEHLERPEAQSRELQLQHHAAYAATVERWLSQFLRRWIKLGDLVGVE